MTFPLTTYVPGDKPIWHDKSKPMLNRLEDLLLHEARPLSRKEIETMLGTANKKLLQGALDRAVVHRFAVRTHDESGAGDHTWHYQEPPDDFNRPSVHNLKKKGEWKFDHAVYTQDVFTRLSQPAMAPLTKRRGRDIVLAIQKKGYA